MSVGNLCYVEMRIISEVKIYALPESENNHAGAKERYIEMVAVLGYKDVISRLSPFHPDYELLNHIPLIRLRHLEPVAIAVFSTYTGDTVAVPGMKAFSFYVKHDILFEIVCSCHI